MIYGALSTLLLYAVVDVLRARHRFLETRKSWSSEREALRALRRIGI